MKTLRYVVTAVLIAGLSTVAKADQYDFQFKVLDPVPPPGTSITFVDGSAPFSVEFGACPSDIAANGCFFGYNESNQTFTFLDVTFTNSTNPSDPTDFFDYLNSQPAACVTSPAYSPSNPQGSLFGAASCALSPDGSVYTLDLSGGNGISPGMTFILAETGADPSAFGVGTAVVGTTPEPGSIWMALSSAASLGYVLRRRRGWMAS
jgi:hypothetical protein